MFFVRIAELDIQINNKYEFVYRLCKDYYIQQTQSPDMIVEVSDVMLEEEMTATDSKFSYAYIEAVCVYRIICMRLPVEHGAYLFHSALISYNGQGYAFAARSGVGKSTHISLWKKAFGDEVDIINGDKPIFKMSDNKIIAFGTPWCGKEGWNKNSSVVLCGIIFLQRVTDGEKNSIELISPEQSLRFIFDQIFTPHELREVDGLFNLLDYTLKNVPCYLLKCNISIEAAIIARDAIVKN